MRGSVLTKLYTYCLQYNISKIWLVMSRPSPHSFLHREQEAHNAAILLQRDRADYLYFVVGDEGLLLVY